MSDYPKKVLEAKLTIQMIGENGRTYEMEYLLESIKLDMTRERAPIYTSGSVAPQMFTPGKTTVSFTGTGSGTPRKRIIESVDKKYPSEKYILDTEMGRFDTIEIDD